MEAEFSDNLSGVEITQSVAYTFGKAASPPPGRGKPWLQPEVGQLHLAATRDKSSERLFCRGKGLHSEAKSATNKTSSREACDPHPAPPRSPPRHGRRGRRQLPRQAVAGQQLPLEYDVGVLCPRRHFPSSEGPPPGLVPHAEPGRRRQLRPAPASPSRDAQGRPPCCLRGVCLCCHIGTSARQQHPRSGCILRDDGQDALGRPRHLLVLVGLVTLPLGGAPAQGL